MDLYSEELELDVLNLKKDVGLHQTEINFASGTVSQGSVSATELNTECSNGSKKSVPLTEVSSDGGIFSQECVLATEICTEKEINSSKDGPDNQKSEPKTEVSTKDVQVTEEKGNQVQTCSRKEDDSSPIEKEVKQIKRKKRHSQEDAKPIRESKRKRTCPLVINYERPDKLRTFWTNDDRLNLLKGLEEFGSEDITSIKTNYLPEKPESSIYNQIRTLKECGRHELEKKLITEKVKRSDYATNNCILKLNEWIEHFENLADLSPQRLFALSNVFLLISEYGSFPSPNLCEGIDLRAMYRYLHCMLNGKPHFGLNQRTADILHQIINHSLRNSTPHTKRMSVLNDIAKEEDIKPEKTYSRCPRSQRVPRVPAHALDTKDAILQLPDLNPLNIPPDLLIKEDSDSENSCSDDNSNNEDCKRDFPTYSKINIVTCGDSNVLDCDGDSD